MNLAQIRINTAETCILINQLSQMKIALDDQIAEVSAVRGNLGIKVLASAEIDNQFTALLRDLQKKQEELSRYQDFLTQANDLFSAADQRVSGEARNVNYLLDQINHAETVLTPSALTLSAMTALSGVTAAGALFHATPSSTKDNVSLSDLWDNIKTGSSRVKGIKSLAELIDVLSKYKGIDDFIGGLKELTGTTVFKSVGWTKDAHELIASWNNGDADAVEKLLVKYIKKGSTTAFGLSGFVGTIVGNLGWNLGENLIDIDQYANPMTRTDSAVVGYCKYAWHVTGGTLIESTTETAYDIVDKLDGVFGWDVDKAYENAVGKSGIEGVFEGTKQIYNYFKEDFSGGVQVVGDTVCAWGKDVVDSIGSWFD